MGFFVADLRNLLNQIEQICEEIARDKGVEHLAGPQGWALMYLYNRREEETFVKDIETAMKISKSVASNLVKRMEKNGFIQVVPSIEDKRYKQLVLTKEGLEKVAPLIDFHDELQKSLFYNIKKEEFQTVMRWTDQLKENINTYKEKKHV